MCGCVCESMVSEGERRPDDPAEKRILFTYLYTASCSLKDHKMCLFMSLADVALSLVHCVSLCLSLPISPQPSIHPYPYIIHPSTQIRSPARPPSMYPSIWRTWRIISVYMKGVKYKAKQYTYK